MATALLVAGPILVDTWAESVCIHQPALKPEFNGCLCSADGSLLVLINAQ